MAKKPVTDEVRQAILKAYPNSPVVKAHLEANTELLGDLLLQLASTSDDVRFSAHEVLKATSLEQLQVKAQNILDRWAAYDLWRESWRSQQGPLCPSRLPGR